MNFTAQEKNELMMGSVRGGKKNPKLFSKYFKTTHWREKRAEKLGLQPVCQLCRVRKATEVHHCSYTCFFNEHIYRDLISTCKGCHGAISRRTRTFKRK